VYKFDEHEQNEGPTLIQGVGPERSAVVTPERSAGLDFTPDRSRPQPRIVSRRANHWIRGAWPLGAIPRPGRAPSRGGGGRSGGAIGEGSGNARRADLIDANGPIPRAGIYTLWLLPGEVVRIYTAGRDRGREGGACSRRLALLWSVQW